MVLTIDYLGDGDPLVWSLDGTADEPAWSASRDPDYRPTVYAVAARGMQERDPNPKACLNDLEKLRETLEIHPAVVDLGFMWKQPGFRFAEQPVLQISVDRIDSVRGVARFLENRGPPGQTPYRAFDVYFAPEFRYCLDTDTSPIPSRPPTVLRLGLSQEAAAEKDLTGLTIAPDTTVPTDNGPPLHGDELCPLGDSVVGVLRTLQQRLAAEDPDVLVVDRSDIVPLVGQAASTHDIDVGLPRVPNGLSRSRLPTYQQLASESTFESYGRRLHSPARYNVPGRVVIDWSNTFFLEETNLAGALDLVARSGKPLQELSWASIGNVLTAIQVREARSRDVLVQWRAWRPERFKTAGTLHEADRGGTTLSPVVGVHDDVYELDFASLYPNIITEFNLSPETVRCQCYDRDEVPELGYSVCDREGYLPDVFQPIIDDRAEIKRRLAEEDLSAAERRALEGQSDALKWILVSCFGYQGFSNAKFGRIEVHEAINAYARDILLTAKEHLEAGGWTVLHGIVDSSWVTPRDDTDQDPVERLASDISEAVGITLEYENAFDWVAFCPRRDGQGGALTRYFGRRRETDTEDRYKIRGIECRQRSTPAWISQAQQTLIETFDEHRQPGVVLDRLEGFLDELQAGEVPATQLLRRTRVSKSVDAYTHETRSVAALRRAEQMGLDPSPGQDVVYIVADDTKDGIDRVRLVTEVSETTPYDPDFYQSELIRATVSILSPLGWSKENIQAELAGIRVSRVTRFT